MTITNEANWSFGSYSASKEMDAVSLQSVTWGASLRKIQLLCTNSDSLNSGNAIIFQAYFSDDSVTWSVDAHASVSVASKATQPMTIAIKGTRNYWKITATGVSDGMVRAISPELNDLTVT